MTVRTKLSPLDKIIFCHPIMGLFTVLQQRNVKNERTFKIKEKKNSTTLNKQILHRIVLIVEKHENNLNDEMKGIKTTTVKLWPLFLVQVRR